MNTIRRAFSGLKAEEAADKVIDLFSRTKTNEEFCRMMKTISLI